MTALQSPKIEYRFSNGLSIKNKLEKLNFDSHVELENILSAYSLTNSQNTRDLTIQKSLKSTIKILDHQIMCAKKVKNVLNGRAILADEVGLGKTIEAGILLKEYFVTGMIKNALILTPPSLRTQWQQELKSKFNLDFVVNKDDERFRDYDKHEMLISSLSASTQSMNSEILKKVNWDIVIVDEAHRLKNEKTKAHKFVQSLDKKFILLLSATPVQNSIKELFNMVDIVRNGLLGTWKDFASVFTIDDRARIINRSKKDELQDMLQQVVIRTTRDEVRKYLQFTDRIPKTHIMQSSEEESQLYEEATDFVRELWKKQRGGRLFILPLMMLQRQISSSTECLRVALQNKMEEFPDESDEIMELLNKASTIKKDTKMKELEKIIETDPDEKYLIFTEFRNTQNYIFNTLKNNGLSIAKFNGDMSPRGRDSAVMEFKKDVNILVSTEAGGEGQNFQFCSNVINYDLPWNPMKVEQRVGRVHRIGQKNNVHIHNLAISGTIEDYILKMLFDKINLFKMTIGDLESLFEEEGLTSISRDAFESYMSATSKKELENKFSALGKKWIHKQEKIDEVKKEFHKDVWANVDLSSLEK